MGNIRELVFNPSPAFHTVVADVDHVVNSYHFSDLIYRSSRDSGYQG